MSASLWKTRMKRLIFSFIVVAPLILLSPKSQAERIRESLEQFDLASLRLYEVYKDKCGMLASILDPNGYVHTVRRGNYVGKNFGMIMRISKNKIFLREVYLAGPDDWQEREVFMEKIK